MADGGVFTVDLADDRRRLILALQQSGGYAGFSPLQKLQKHIVEVAAIMGRAAVLHRHLLHQLESPRRSCSGQLQIFTLCQHLLVSFPDRILLLEIFE